MLPAGRMFVNPAIKHQCIYISCCNKKIHFVFLAIFTISRTYIINLQYVNLVCCKSIFVILCYIQNSPRDYLI
jgi:hypothetical protein